MRAGIAVSSPFPGIAARRWLEAAEAAVRRFGPAGLAEVLDMKRFHELEWTLGTAAGFVACPVCGDWFRERGLVGHQRSSTRCRFLASHREVEAAWEQGWRDPWSLRPAVAVVWSELCRPRWRSWVRVVEYPQWNAVLVAPRFSRA